jgi:serine/threonine-protein kinase
VFYAFTHGAEGFRRPVAVKRILDHLAEDPSFVAMFVEEARVTAALTHPNIVQIHDFAEDSDGAFFLVMEWVDGVNLFHWQQAYLAAGEHTPWHLVAAAGIEVLKALHGAHEHEDNAGRKVPVFHRDVTPQNILIGANGVVKLTDFGLARAMDRARMTQPQMLKGKLSYVAPEMITGGDPSVQTDLFGIGIVLWETLAGRKLFDGEGPLQILSKVKDADVPPLSDIRPDIPRALHDAIHRALEKEPTARFKSARSMVRALANILRMTPESTSSEVVARTVRLAQQRLRDAIPPTQELSASELEALIDEPSHIPLTTRKKS